MINTLRLGSESFPVNIIQGPLAGISCAPFRRLSWEYSKPAFSYTEMISCKTLLYKVRSQERFIKKHPLEGSVGFQLSGRDPGEVGEATKRVTDCGADLIDLNCGCPVTKIRTRGAGSSLLKDPMQIFQLITAMKRNTHVPVSIKIRVDGHSKDNYNKDIVSAVNDSGADFITVHGRHWTEHYETSCNYEQIQYFVENLKIPVIGNGDVSCIDSLKKMYATGCAGVMVGRAGVGQPWLIGKLIAEMQQKPFIIPAAPVIGNLFITHITELVELLQSEKFAVIQARKFTKYYARSLEHRAEIVQEINGCETLDSFVAICLRYFGLGNSRVSDISLDG